MIGPEISTAPIVFGSIVERFCMRDGVREMDIGGGAGVVVRNPVREEERGMVWPGSGGEVALVPLTGVFVRIDVTEGGVRCVVKEDGESWAMCCGGAEGGRTGCVET